MTTTEKTIAELSKLAAQAAKTYDNPVGLKAIYELKMLKDLIEEKYAEATDRLYLASLEHFGSFAPVEVPGVGKVSARVTKGYIGLGDEFYTASGYERKTINTDAVIEYKKEHNGKLPDNAEETIKVSLIFPKKKEDEQG